MSRIIYKEIQSNHFHKYKYSICTLVTNFKEYEEMINSFKEAGFDELITEFLYADNTNGNRYDAYTALNIFLQQAEGKYIILCHQDVLLKFDKIDKLNKCLEELDIIDCKWAVVGNAGGVKVRHIAKRLTQKSDDYFNEGVFPAKVSSLDENFILVKKSANLALSSDLDGFHFYGTDLCIIAKILGFNSYVIDFHLLHKSAGYPDTSYYKSKWKLLKKYERVFKERFIVTPITAFYLSGSSLKNKLFNTRFSWFWINHYFRPKKKNTKTVND